MTDSARSPLRYRFGVFDVDLRTGEVRKAGSRLRLGPQPLRVLQALLERPSDLVTREELQQCLWPGDTFVEFENNLNSAVRRLRTVLGDSADSPRFIETVPRRGYRFLAAVEVLPPAAAKDHRPEAPETAPAGLATPEAGPAAHPHPAPGIAARRALGLLVMLSLAVAALIAFAWTAAQVDPAVRAASEPAHTALAVLPFENLTGDAVQDFLADGTTEALIAGLARIGSIRVISRTSVMRFRGSRQSVPEIARELGVTAVLEGSVRRSGDQVRITAQLIDAATDAHLWAGSYSGTMTELLSLQGRAARAVAREVRATLTPSEEARLTQTPSVDPVAQEAYLKGRYFWNQRTADGLARAIGYFKEALSIESTHASTHAALADAYNLLPRYGSAPTRQALLEAKQHALAALALDANSADAHAALAKVQHSLDWDWTGAERNFLEAIELSPGYATAHHWYSIFLLTVGRLDEGIAEASRARELDPLSPVVNLHLAYSLYLGGRLEASATRVERTLELEPRYANAHFLTGWIRLREGNLEAARAAFTTAIELTSNPREYLPGIVAVDVAEGRTADARRVLRTIEAGNPGGDGSGQPAMWALVALGDIDGALRLVERDFENRSVCFYLFHLTNHWFLAPLRADARLAALYESAGLGPPVARQSAFGSSR